MGGTLWIGMALFLVAMGLFLLFTELPFGTILVATRLEQYQRFRHDGPAHVCVDGRDSFSQPHFAKPVQGADALDGSHSGQAFACECAGLHLFCRGEWLLGRHHATVGKITVPELVPRLQPGPASGSLAGAGTLGFLIPPSMMMLVYGIIGDVSIGKLFIAGIIPGILLAAMFSGYIALRCLITPSLASSRQRMPQLAGTAGCHMWKFLPVLLLILVVLGSLYTGCFTPTEAGAVGVVGALVFAFFTKSPDRQVFTSSLMGTIKTSAMIMFIIMGASYLSVVVGYLGITRELTIPVTKMGLSPSICSFSSLRLLYLVLGCLVDGFFHDRHDHAHCTAPGERGWL